LDNANGMVIVMRMEEELIKILINHLNAIKKLPIWVIRMNNRNRENRDVDDCIKKLQLKTT